jgi:hypothetical protein
MQSITIRPPPPSLYPSQNLENKGKEEIDRRKIFYLKELDIKILHPKDLARKTAFWLAALMNA